MATMDTDYPTISIKKYASFIDHNMSSTSEESKYLSGPNRRPDPSSAFERLPLEIRQMVYSHLCYPVGCETWEAAWEKVTIHHSRGSYSISARSRPIHVRVLKFNCGRWDQRPLSTGRQGLGFTMDLEHALLDDYRTRDHVSKLASVLLVKSMSEWMDEMLMYDTHIRTFSLTETAFHFYLSTRISDQSSWIPYSPTPRWSLASSSVTRLSITIDQSVSAACFLGKLQHTQTDTRL
jgi:hypothetical protein